MYDYGFRIYDPRLAKFLSIDPLSRKYPWYTPYQFAGNMPIDCIDLDGLEEVKTGTVQSTTRTSAQLKTPTSTGNLMKSNILRGSLLKSPNVYVIVFDYLFGDYVDKGIKYGVEKTLGKPKSINQTSTNPNNQPKLTDNPLPKDPPVERDEDEIILYRGVPSTMPTSPTNELNPAYPPATVGVAVPRGGTDDPVKANNGAPSNFTFWTTKKELAKDFATNGDETHGILLEKKFPKSVVQNNLSPDRYGEGEVQIYGTVVGATPTLVLPFSNK